VRLKTASADAETSKQRLCKETLLLNLNHLFIVCVTCKKSTGLIIIHNTGSQVVVKIYLHPTAIKTQMTLANNSSSEQEQLPK